MKIRQIATHICIALGVALLVIAVAVPTYMVPKLKVIPLDTTSKTTTETGKGILLSSQALATGKPSGTNATKEECQGEKPAAACFIDKGVDLYSSRYVTAQEPSNDKQITLQVGNVLMHATNRTTDSSSKEATAKEAATDLKEKESSDLISATIDRITLNRRTAFPVKEPVSTITMNAPIAGFKASTAPFVRDGYQYQFPFGTERRSYPYFDIYTGKSTPIDFVDAVQQKGTTVFKNGTTVYQFHQDLGPVDLYDSTKKLMDTKGTLTASDKASLASLRLNMPGRMWGLDTDDNVQMDRYYVNSRTINVEPTTGVITYGEEKIWMFYAQNEADAKRIVNEREQELNNPTRTAIYFDAKWDKDTQDRQMQKADKALGPLNILSKVVPWVAGILGVILLLLGLWLFFGSRRTAASK